MTILLAMGVVQAQGASAADSAHMAAILAAVGYPFLPRARDGSYGNIEHQGAVVTARLRRWNPGLAGRRGAIPSLALEIELGFAKEVPDGHSPIDSPYALRPGADGVSFVSHLGGTVTVKEDFSLPPDLTPTTLKDRLDAFWKATGDFAHDHGGRFEPAPKRKWSQVRFPDDVVLPRADPVSIDRLIVSWHWTYPKGWGHSGNGFAVPLELEGTDLWMHWPGTGQPFDAFVTLGGMGWSLVPETIDLSRGIRVGEFHQRIQSFAKRQGKRDREGGPDASAKAPIEAPERACRTTMM